MPRQILAVFMAITFWFSFATHSGSGELPKRAITLGLDFSGSMFSNWEKGEKGVLVQHITLQQIGTAKALIALADAIASRPTAISIYSWSSGQQILVPWVVVVTPEQVISIASQLLMLPLVRGDHTEQVKAVSFGLSLFEDPVVAGAITKVVDISTDGVPQKIDADGLDMERALAEKGGIQVNAIAVEREPVSHPEKNGSAGGPTKTESIVEALQKYLVTDTGFVVRATSWSEYTDALVRKLELELVS